MTKLFPSEILPSTSLFFGANELYNKFLKLDKEMLEKYLFKSTRISVLKNKIKNGELNDNLRINKEKNE